MSFAFCLDDRRWLILPNDGFVLGGRSVGPWLTAFAFGVGIMLTQLVLSLGGFIPKSGFIHLVFQNSLYTGVIAMLCGLVIVPLVSLCTQKKRPKNVEEIFDCYNIEVKVRAASSLEDEK